MDDKNPAANSRQPENNNGQANVPQIYHQTAAKRNTTSANKIIVCIIAVMLVAILVVSSIMFKLFYNEKSLHGNISMTAEVSSETFIKVAESSSLPPISQPEAEIKDPETEKIEKAIKSDAAQIKPSTGKVTTAAEFKDDGKEDAANKPKNENIDKDDSSKPTIPTVNVDPKPPSGGSQTDSGKKYIVFTTATDVNVRTGPGVKNSKIGKMVTGMNYQYLSEAADSTGTIWYKIKFNDKDGWVTSQYANKIEAPQPGSSSDSSKPQDTSQPSGSQSSSSSSSSSPSSSESSTPSTPSTPPSTPQNGWYTVDGKKYYYQNYVPIKGWADIAGMRYYFDETTGEKKSLCGIDVSSHQGDINWAAVKEAGIEFAFIRVGYRGYETGKINLDSKFVRNITEAKKYGIKCGVYFYSVAKDEVEAAQEANFVLAALEGYTLDLPIVIDVEHRSDRVAGLSAAQRTNNTLAFIKVIKDSGRQVMIYTGHYFYHNYLEKNRLADIPLWIAYYTDDNKKVADVNYSYWQYTSSGKVPGISGNVDLDIYIPR